MTQPMADQVHLIGLSSAFSGRKFPVLQDEFVVGRSPQNDMVIDQKTISGKHAKIVKEEEYYEIQDLNSTNGTFVNNEKIDRKILRTQDKIKFDIYEFQFINPLDVPRTVLVDSFVEKNTDKTMIRSAAGDTHAQEQTMRLNPPEQTVRLTSGNRGEKIPQTDQTVPLTTEERTEPVPLPFTKKSRGHRAAGLFAGIIIAILIGGSGTFVGAWSTMNYAAAHIRECVLHTLTLYPIQHTPDFWLNIHPSFSTITPLAAIVLGFILGGWVTQLISRKSRVIDAFFFAVYSVVVVFAAQLAGLKFHFAAFKNLYSGTGIYLQQPLMNLALTMGAIFLIAFIFVFIGSLFSRK